MYFQFRTVNFIVLLKHSPLVLRDCRLVNTTLAFEYSSVDADVRGTIDSVFNPSSGTIRADHINELTLDPAKIDPTATTIVTADAA